MCQMRLDSLALEALNFEFVGRFNTKIPAPGSSYFDALPVAARLAAMLKYSREWSY